MENDDLFVSRVVCVRAFLLRLAWFLFLVRGCFQGNSDHFSLSRLKWILLVEEAATSLVESSLHPNEKLQSLVEYLYVST